MLSPVGPGGRCVYCRGLDKWLTLAWRLLWGEGLRNREREKAGGRDRQIDTVNEPWLDRLQLDYIMNNTSIPSQSAFWVGKDKLTTVEINLCIRLHPCQSLKNECRQTHWQWNILTFNDRSDKREREGRESGEDSQQRAARWNWTCGRCRTTLSRCVACSMSS